MKKRKKIVQKKSHPYLYRNTDLYKYTDLYLDADTHTCTKS